MRVCSAFGRYVVYACVLWCMTWSVEGKAADISRESVTSFREALTNTPSHDGFGSQFQLIIWSLFYTEVHNKEFLYTPFTRMEHNYHDDPGFLSKKEELINFIGNFEISSTRSDVKQLTIPECGKFVSNFSNILAFETSKTREKVRRIFKANKNVGDYFDVERFNIAVHIRRPNPHDSRIEGTDTPDAVYLNIIKKLRDIHSSKPVQFHIYSQGDLQSFKDVYDSEDVVFHINESVETTFASMVLADALVMSNSALSYTAAMISEGIMYYTFYPYPPFSEWKIAANL